MRTYRFAVVGAVLACGALVGCVRTDTELLYSSTVVISARGTAFDTPATVVKATLAQAAQLAQSHGFQYFKIISASDATRLSTIYTPAETHSSGSLNGSVTAYGNFGELNAQYNGTSYTTPGQAYTFIKPGADVMLKLYHDGEVDSRAPGVWSVASVLGIADTHSVQQSNFSPPPTGGVRLPSATNAPPSQSVAPAAMNPSPTDTPLQSYDDWQKSHRN